MDWFRNLLVEKAEAFQIIVLTCRESDYFAHESMVEEGDAVYRDGRGAPVRAINLARALRRS
jgi:hypothetical protein